MQRLNKQRRMVKNNRVKYNYKKNTVYIYIMFYMILNFNLTIYLFCY